MKQKLIADWNSFWTKPASAKPLAVLRIATALILLVQAYFVAPHFLEIYGSDGVLQGALRAQFDNSPVPGIYELANWFARFGVTEMTILAGLAALYLYAVVSLLLGRHTRMAAVLLWLCHVTLSTGHVSSYGLDTFVSIILFYFLWMPVGAAYSLDVASGRTESEPSAEARVSLRILQLHLSIAYLACGLDKAAGIQWWNGEAIWRSLLLPVYAHGDFTWLARFPLLAKLAGWGTLLVECGYPVGMWFPRLRKLTLVSIIGLHLGIFFFLGLHLFALVMMAFSFSAFGVNAEPEAALETEGWRGLIPLPVRRTLVR